MKINFAKFIFVLLASVLVLSCSKEESKPENTGKLKIVATTGMIDDAIKNIAGDRVEIIKVICGPGVDPHSYVPSVSDAEAIMKADLVFYNGVGLEAKMGEILASKGSEKSIAIGNAIPKDSLIDINPDDNIEDYDPHIWNNPLIWKYSIQRIIDVLVEKDPLNANFYKDNGADYLRDVFDAYNYALYKYQQIPAENRILVTGHDAFRYFSRAYSFEVKAVHGITTETEAGIKELRELADYVVEKKVHVLFFETMVNNKSVEALRNAVQSRNHEIQISDKPLYSDALGDESPVDTYIGIIKYNADLIQNELTSGHSE
ncbi:MAG: zinc ABC transporter substrate-binding protein [Candidatus Kapabacteria bacterium]|nr:zinc ABC transporter substrate-binding protein [Candidatus Kapabacteria bacterium]